MDDDSRLLRKVDPDRREFLKRLSLAAAYATPVVTSFSFDSLIPSAEAQGSYARPARVLDLVFIPAAGTKGLIVSRVAETEQVPYGTIRITYSKPMETSLNSCKRATGCECEIIESQIDKELYAARAAAKERTATAPRPRKIASQRYAGRR